MDTFQKHRSLYKGTTPPWKETFRKRCVERLRSNRARLLDKYRQMGESMPFRTSGSIMVQEVMEVEWSELKANGNRLPSLWQKDSFRDVLTVMKEDDELSVLEEIQKELISQEQAIIEEYERSVFYEEQCLNAMVEGMDSNDSLICPLCSKNHLTITSQFISCRCGTYINTQNRNITKAEIRCQLESRVNEHCELCPHPPMFFVEGSFSLLMCCQGCDHLAVIV
ncbi:RPA-interacting protein [Erpetoichthys calabaricus]|uniref:RPA interacting protein n=1 Tax=Erpetoichthys calabaricus TaxID=27687 RepID=A0A8C4T5I8_ERPCA|nr:RPA-interacting protein [Erpetoichthys calabaricus]XP_051786799.1 RPA-interacting protein [Erpetoichthys calabaricus]